MRQTTPVQIAILSMSVFALATGGCGRHGRYREPVSPDMRDPATKVDMLRPPADAPTLSKPEPPDGVAKAMADKPAAPSLSLPMLAYSYDFSLEAAAGKVGALEARHEAACTNAGAIVCQVTRSTVNDVGDGDVQAELELRATPAWVAAFRAHLAGDTKDAGGRILSQTSSSVDLSRDIADTDADLRAKTLLRDRLEGLLANHPGTLSDLVDLEQSLSQVQGEIDTTQSELAVMRGRVTTSAVTISYRRAGHRPAGGTGVWAPITDAFGDFFMILAMGLGFMVRAAAVLLPWALVIGGLLWLFRKRLWGRLRRDKVKDTGPAV